MATLRDVMTTDVITVSPDLSLRELADLFASEHISGAPVVSGDQILGVVSTTDLLEFEASTSGSPMQRQDQTEWGDWDSPKEWSEDDEAPSLYFSDLWADAGADVLERFRQTERPEWDVLAEHTVSEVMTRKLCMLTPDTELPVAAVYMLDAGVHRVLVVEDEQLVGVVTTTDVVQAVAEHGLGTAAAAD